MSVSESVDIEERVRIQELVYRSCMCLNGCAWDEFLALCEPKRFTYSVENYSPEIEKKQCWLKLDYSGFSHLIEMLPKHNTDHAQLTRQPVVYTVRNMVESDRIEVTSGVSIYRTFEDSTLAHIDGGKTSLYAVGMYIDEVELSDEGPSLAARKVWLHTRQLDIGSHYPL